MAKIKELSSQLRDRIAAGEVIDRPYSVVKELVENSIDAGATEIEISIEHGGKDNITVTDNGCGISKEDLRSALLAHYTSKITELDDIDHIHTLGFRGEALASMVSVAVVELSSKVEGQPAYAIEAASLDMDPVTPAPDMPRGTRINVGSIFFNTPIRFAFLKSDKKEETDITTYVIRYILGNPQIAFKYYADEELKLQSYGGGLEEAIVQVYGSKVLPNCYKISVERNDIKISGFISNQQFFKPNKSYQNVFINGRYINNQIIGSAINNAYAPYMMKKNYPFYVLFIQMPDELLDVNVHPNKTDVRFSNNSLVYGTIYKTISEILDGSVKAAEYVVSDNNTSLGANKQLTIPYAAEYIAEKIRDKGFSDVKDIDVYAKMQPEANKNYVPVKNTYDSYFVEDKPVRADESVKPVESSVNTDSPAAQDAESTTLRRIDAPVREDDFLPSNIEEFSRMLFGSGAGYELKNREREEKERKFEEEKQQAIIYAECKYKCTLFNTYLVYEMRNDVYLIDQHAAHERLLYDRMKAEMETRKNIPRQATLIPYNLIINPEEAKFLDDNMDAIWQMGFTLEPFGTNAFLVTEFPADFKDMDYKEFFNELLSDMSELKEAKLVDILKDKIAQSACKHAVKGGEILTDTERDRLFDMLHGNLGLKCPHGRPVCVKLSKKELEKMFKRIV